MSAPIYMLNPNADAVKQSMVLSAVTSAAIGLQKVVRTNLGPTGTIKMLVSGAGEIKLTKDGKVLLTEMSFQNPMAAMIARSAVAQDAMVGDGTTTNVILIGEILRNSSRYVFEGIHPRIIAEGIETAKKKALEILESNKIEMPKKKEEFVKIIKLIVNTSLETKLDKNQANLIAPELVEAVNCIGKMNNSIDLHMIEIITIENNDSLKLKLLKGLVLDHGARHPDMPKDCRNAHVLILNLSLEYEKTEVNSGFFYSNIDQKNALVDSERAFVNEKLDKILKLKETVCKEGESFVLINQKGIDPEALDILAKNGILALRRAKRRNMERLQKCCGGVSQNSVEDLDRSILGFAGHIYQLTFNDEKYLFVEDTKKSESVTLIIYGGNKQEITKVNDAIRDGLRSAKNAIEDMYYLPGAGSIYAILYYKLIEYSKQIIDKSKIGVEVFADAMLSIPKVLALNSGLDPHEIAINLIDKIKKGQIVGLNLDDGSIICPITYGILDNYRVVKNLLYSSAAISINLLLIDEIMRAGKSSLKENNQLQQS